MRIYYYSLCSQCITRSYATQADQTAQIIGATKAEEGDQAAKTEAPVKARARSAAYMPWSP